MHRVTTALVACFLTAQFLGGGLAVRVASAGTERSVPSDFLGKPTNDFWDSPTALGGYHHTGTVLRRNFRLEVLLMGTSFDYDDFTNVVSWPLIKALLQFGSFSALPPLTQHCAHMPSSTGPGYQNCSGPGYDLRPGHAKYASRYVSFVFRDLQDQGRPCLKRSALSASELALLKRFHVFFREKGHPGCSALGGDEGSNLPIVSAGGYAQGGIYITTDGDLETFTTPSTPNTTTPGVALSTATVRSYLSTGTEPKGSTLLYHVNAEANLITALICHADGKKPGSVCRRGVIRKIMRSIH